jgi:hypothetical protein
LKALRQSFIDNRRERGQQLVWAYNCISLNLLLSQAYAVNCSFGFFKIVVKDEMAAERGIDSGMNE